MLQVSKFKLIDGGKGGVQAEGRSITPLPEGGYNVVDNAKLTRRLDTGTRIFNESQLLKYYFLNLTRHWIEPFNEYYDVNTHALIHPEGQKKKGHRLLNDIWARTEITGATLTEDGFVITGSIDSVDGKKLGLATPHITEEDDIGFYTAAREKITICVNSVVRFFNDASIEGTIENLSSAESKGMSDLQKRQLALEKLEARQAVIRFEPFQPALDRSHGSDEEKTKLHTRTGNIDSKNLPNAGLEEDERGNGGGEEEEDPRDKAVKDNIKNEKKKNIFRPASEGEFGNPGGGKGKHPGDGVAASDMENLENSADAEGVTQVRSEDKAQWED